MQVSVETTSELSRKMTVQVPEEKIQEQVNTRLRGLAGRVKIDGFRPGKAPQSLIKKRFGPSVRDEVVADLIQSSFYDAVRDEKLNLAASPMITPKESAEGKGLVYEADFEVVPEFSLASLETLEVTRFASTVAESDVDGMVLRLREQRKTWQEAGRPAAEGDRLTIHFEGVSEGENFTDGKVENFQVVIGSKQLIPGFEDGLVGAAAGGALKLELSFPEDYGNKKLAGKTAEFTVEIEKVEEGVLPEVESEGFLESFGVENGDVASFRDDIKGNMEREMNRALASRTKTSVMDALYAAHSALPLPRVMVDQEVEHMLNPYRQTAKKRQQHLDEAPLKERFEPIARRRVSLGLVLGKIIEAEKLSVDAKRVRAAVEDLAVSYESPEQVVSWYYSNPEQLRQVESMVLEDQVVDAVLAKAKVNEEQVAFAELMKSAQQESAAT